MADVIKGLKLSRRNLKGQLTRTLSTIDSLLKDDVSMLKIYIAKAEEQFSKIEDKHAELTQLIESDEEFEVEEKWMTDCEMDFVQKLIRARLVVDRHPQSTLDDPHTSTSPEVQQEEPTLVDQSPSSENSARSSHAPRMARIKFPTFSGEIRDYLHFKSMFHHCTQDLSDIECFFQLTEAMQNQKERNMVKSCVNVQRAWQMLDECFGDRDRVVDSLLRDLDGLKSYEHKGKISTSAMAHFIQILQNFECQAETVGLSGELNSRIMLSQIKQKLPESHRMDYYKGVRDDNIDDSLSGLTKWLYRQYLLIEKVKSAPEDYRNQTSRSDRASKASNATTFDTPKQSQSKGKQSGVPKCALHPNSSTHYLKTCNKFRSLPLPEKYDIMRRNNICQRCGHNNCVAGKHPYDLNACQFAAPCRSQNCGSDRHFSAICPVIYGHTTKPHPNGDADRSSTTSANVKTVTNRDSSRLQSTLPTVMGYIRHGNTRRLVRILLDCGSQVTLLREGILPKTSTDFYQDHDLSLVGGRKITKKLRILECHIEDLRGNWSCPLTVTEIDEPCGDAQIVRPEHLQTYDHLREIEVPIAPSETIDLLLGVENTHLMVWEDYIIGDKPDEPVAVQSPFGWFIQGGKSSSSAHLLNYVNVSAVGPLEEFIGIETVGLEPRKCKCSSDDEKGATEIMQKSVIQLPDGSYEVRLPWKRSPDELPDNYDYAVKRQRSLENQFRDRPNEWEVYCQQMRDQLKRGVSRLVSQEELQRDRDVGRRMWFLPHFGVVKDSKTTPVRVVYDGKAKFQGRSLNDCLIKGENVNSNLFEVALRFRENEVGVIADISKMFQAIKISPEDARFHRFVFRENPNHPIHVYELTTVTFGDKPSPTAAIVTLRHVAREHAPGDDKLQRVIVEQFYMDDLNESVSNVEEALELKSKLTETLKKGKFNIRKWQSNARKVCDETEDADFATALGTRWNLLRDTLSVKEVRLSRDPIPTKRKILAQTASYYDVFGMLSGLLVRPKILLQKLWQLDVGWDTPLDGRPDLCAMLHSINIDLEEASTLEIPRCLIPEKYRGKRPLPDVSLHGASDASEDAMGIGVWLRWSDPRDDTAQLSFVAARARLTPLKQSSIPRKELQAVLLLSRLMITLKNALRFNLTYSRIWTDSLTAISWLRGQSKSFRSFVAYRVGEITAEFDPHQDIAFVPSELNAIDAVSRGCTAMAMMKVTEGPTYLMQPRTTWPQTPQSIPIESTDPERKKFHVRNAKAFALKVYDVTHPTALVDPTKFSSWNKLKMITARVLSLKAVHKREWLKRLTQQIAQWPSVGFLRKAELYWIRVAQKDINFQDHNIMRLDPFFDDKDKVYRVGGRIRHAPLSYDVRHPYLLPRANHISLLIVRDAHVLALHGGQLRTASEVRKRYWVVGDTKLSRHVVRRCTICRRHKGRPLEQKMADLPESRVKPHSPPFQTTLVDYLGPVNVKVNRNTTSKGYCAVFTCAVIRAVHLTCVQDLSTQAFLQALDRFVSIRGAPATIISDNGTCFRGAHNKINELNLRLDQTELREHCNRFKVQWKFGPPGGPHHQGAVERMVQEVKKAMRHLVKADRLSFPEWETVLCQISGLINNRPLTAVSSSPLDHPPLTPNHFLIGRGDLQSPDVPCEQYHGDFRKRRELCNAMVDKFWMRWMDCIHKLSPRPKNRHIAENLELGDVVLVIGEDKKRGTWRMAEIVQVFKGKDELVRVVELRYGDKTTAKRPVTKLILLMKRTERCDV